MELTDLVTTVRSALPRVLVAVDFDGTLAPLTDDPMASRPVDGAIDVLSRLAARGARIAVITGRDALTAVSLGGFDAVDAVLVEGLYGAESWQGGTLTTPEASPEMDRVRRELPATLEGGDPRVWIEDKRLSLVVHARKTDDPAAALALVADRVTALALSHGMEVHPGRDVLEIRLPGPDKARALRNATRAGEVTVYLGDDLGDLPAFAEVRRLRSEGERAFAVGVRSSGVIDVVDAADVTVATPVEVVALLDALAS